jgi:hypothetical protein
VAKRPSLSANLVPVLSGKCNVILQAFTEQNTFDPRRRNMKFSTGFWDSLFGKKATIEVKQDDGSVRQVRVTQAWLKQMERDDVLGISTPVQVYVIGPNGSEERQMLVGIDIPEDKYRQLVDPTTGALYALEVIEEGSTKNMIVKKEMWETAKRQYDAIDRASEGSRHKISDLMNEIE